MTGLLSVPTPEISISQMSPSFMFLDVPSVPIQITSPGCKVRYLVISEIYFSTPKIMSLVSKEIVSSPFSLTVVTIWLRSASVSIQGPMGLKVSVFFALHKVLSDACQVRSLTSLPTV